MHVPRPPRHPRSPHRPGPPGPARADNRRRRPRPWQSAHAPDASSDTLHAPQLECQTMQVPAVTRSPARPATGPALGTPPILQVPPFRPATGPAPGTPPPISPGAAFPAGDPAGSQGSHFSRCRLSGRRPGRLSGSPFLQVPPFRPATGPALRDPIPQVPPFPPVAHRHNPPHRPALHNATHPTPATQLARTCLRSMTNVSCSVAGAGSSVLFRPPPHLPWWVQSMRQGAERR